MDIFKTPEQREREILTRALKLYNIKYDENESNTQLAMKVNRHFVDKGYFA
jgi:hypothetical protein